MYTKVSSVNFHMSYFHMFCFLARNAFKHSASEASILISTKALLLTHDYRRQGHRHVFLNRVEQTVTGSAPPQHPSDTISWTLFRCFFWGVKHRVQQTVSGDIPLPSSPDIICWTAARRSWRLENPPKFVGVVCFNTCTVSPENRSTRSGMLVHMIRFVMITSPSIVFGSICSSDCMLLSAADRVGITWLWSIVCIFFNNVVL